LFFNWCYDYVVYYGSVGDFDCCGIGDVLMFIVEEYYVCDWCGWFGYCLFCILLVMFGIGLIYVLMVVSCWMFFDKCFWLCNSVLLINVVIVVIIIVICFVIGWKEFMLI